MAPSVRTLALFTSKGGTGESTATANLAAALAERERRVLVVDLDAQASASRLLGALPAEVFRWLAEEVLSDEETEA